MASQRIIWTALPNGTAPDGRLRLSVYVSPQLLADQANQPLGPTFADFVDWPATLKSVRFRVAIGGHAAVENDALTRESSPDSALWGELFPATAVRVRPYEYQAHHTRPIRSYRVAAAAQFVRATYAQVGLAHAAELPRLDAPQLEAVRQLAPEVLVREGPQLMREVTPGRAPGLAAPPATAAPNASATANVLSHRVEFYRFLQFRAPAVSAVAEAPLAPPQLDFHDAVAALGHHPLLLRGAGLVLDLVLPLKAADLPAAGTVQVLAQWTPKVTTATGPEHHPLTRYRLGPHPDGSGRTYFGAEASADSRLDQGLLRLDGPEYEVVQFDPDSAANQLINTAHRIQRRSTLRRVRSTRAIAEERTGLPALRSGGLILVHDQRERHLQNRLERNFELHIATLGEPPAEIGRTLRRRTGVQAKQPPVLTADDVVRGYRIDVWHDGAWHSLCRRTARFAFVGDSFTFPAASAAALEDEGWVALAVTSPPSGPGTPASLNWNLHRLTVQNTELRLHEALCRWDGWSLVVERPGKVLGPDNLPMARNNDPLPPFKLKPSYDVPAGSLPKLRFGKQYRVRARAVDLAGNSLEPTTAELPHATAAMTYRRYEPVPYPVLVPRRDLSAQPGEKPDYLVIRSNGGQTADSFASNPGVPGSPGYLAVAERHVAAPQTTPQMAEAHGQFDDAQGKPRPEMYALIVARQGALPAVADQNRLDLPYLPDPLSRGVAFTNLPGLSPEQSLVVSTYDNATRWPDPRPFRLVLQEGPFTPPNAAEPAAGGTLTVRLPKGEKRTVRVSSAVAADDLKLLAVWDWLQAEAPAASPQFQAARAAALAGRHWMLTPYREVVLLHAVRQPLQKPEIAGVQVSRAVGDTNARLKVAARTHAKTTGKVDLLADWHDPVDNPGGGPPRPAVSGLVPTGGDARPEGDPRRQALHEEPVTEPAETAPSQLEPQDLALVQQEFGDTKYRRVFYHLVGTTRFREFFHRPTGAVDANPELYTQSGPSYAADVLSTARPAAPEVLYVIPTFRWERSQQGTSRVSRRYGGGLRVYLARPWFSSGDGELLGVVLWPGATPLLRPGPLGRETGSTTRAVLSVLTPAQRKELELHTTQWGSDPVFASAELPAGYPAAGMFSTRVAENQGLPLQENPAVRVDVAGHAVAYDPARDLWYCDLELDAGAAYYPFVRLALARYQPHSVQPEVMLSRVVRADQAQLVPERVATVAPSLGGRGYQVTLTGPGYTATQRGATSSVVEAVVEHQVGAGELGWVPVGDPVPLTSQRGGGWSGAVVPPAAPAGQTRRLALREYEVLPSDELPVGPAIMVPGVSRRLVYAESLPL